MASKVYAFLDEQNISDPDIVDKLIISAYLDFNQIAVRTNQLIRDHIIHPKDENNYRLLEGFLAIIKDDLIVFDFEILIELFEFVISPADKITNGAIYTPKYIRDYLIDQSTQRANNLWEDLKTCDVTCGCGGFLLTLALAIKHATQLTYKEIFRNNIYGLDITEYSITRSKLLLSLLAIQDGEDANFKFNLKVGNALTFNWQAAFPAIRIHGGFDIIVGNPPYVASRNMDEETLLLVKEWTVSQSGHPDLYIPFFQIGYENLVEGGILAFITVNTFMKSINGRALRQYIAHNKIDLTIINFGGEQVFKDRNTYTCLCFLTDNHPSIKYMRADSLRLPAIDDPRFRLYEYANLNHEDGWNMVNSEALMEFIQIIESTGNPFKKLYTTRNGIATLKNNIYKFSVVDQDKDFFYLEEGDYHIPIERDICRDIVNANRIKKTADLQSIREKIIFPYTYQNGTIAIMEEAALRATYPNAYLYLKSKKHILANRDKGKQDRYETWYAYGRRQSMDIMAYKLFFPHICDRPTFVICEERDLLFYNGIAVISDNLEELGLLKKILESDLFFQYIKNTTKDYASGYISMSRNYLKNFGIPALTAAQSQALLDATHPEEILAEFYGVTHLME